MVEVPLRLIEKVIKSGEVDELEDWLLAHDPAFIARMRAARKTHQAGKAKPIEELKKRLCIG